MGIIMFLRIGFMVAYAGAFNSTLIVGLASSLTLLTAISLSAIATNGQIAGGGAYYMISRALGPEFGGSIGVLFYLANAVSVSLYCLGFAETVQNQVLLPQNIEIVSKQYDERLLGILALISAFIVCMVGVSWVVRMEKLLLSFLIAAVSLIILGGLAGPTHRPETYNVLTAEMSDYNSRSDYIPGFQTGQFQLNVKSQFDGPPSHLLTSLDITEFFNGEGLNYNSSSNDPVPQCAIQPGDLVRNQYGVVNFAVVLAVFFPAVSGIMAGANVSGDLKDPSRAIPTGTIAAIIVSGIVYVILIVIVASNGVRSILIKARVLDQEKAIYDCTFGGLFHEPLLPVKMAYFPTIVYLGIYAATLSSALTSLVSAPRILQAVAKDRLFSLLDPLSKTVGEEPIRAYVTTFAIAFLCIMTGDINSVAPLISTFFLASYALVNYACYAAENSGSPGWRPSFVYYSQELALAGALGCVCTMLLLSAVTGFITFVIGLALYKYIETGKRESKGSQNWGPATHARKYTSALKAALVLENIASNSNSSKKVMVDGLEVLGTEETEEEQTRITKHALDATHVKNFRPQILVLSGPPGGRPGLCYLANELRRAHGLNIFADVMIGDVGDVEALEERNRRALLSFLGEFGLRGFGEVILAKSFREGARSLIQLCGLGRVMRVNTVLLGFYSSWNDEHQNKSRSRDRFTPDVSLDEYVGVIRDSFDLGCGVAILRGEDDLFSQDWFRETARMARDSLSPFKVLNPTFSLSEGESNLSSSEADPTQQRRKKAILIHEELQSIDEKWTEIKSLGNIAVKPITEFLQGRIQAIEADSDSDDQNGDLATLPRSPSAVSTSMLSRRRIDVYWFADDGGLTLLLPHLLRQASSPPFSKCVLRVIAVGETRDDAESEQKAMELLLKKLRMTASVQVVSLESQVTMVEGSNGDKVLRRLEKIGGLIAATSPGALLVVCTLPVPHDTIEPKRYLKWLDALSKNCGSPILLTRGSQRDVLTVLS